MREHTRTTRGAAAALVLSTALAGCSGAAPDGGGLAVVTTTEILADLVSQVGGDLVDVSSLVPPGGDPHSYEPTPADAVRVTEADVAFTNHLLLEEQALIKAIDNNIPEDALNVSLAEVSETYGAHVIPLVEDLGLDVVWLGLRVRGDGEELGASRTSTVHLRATGLDGPGDLRLYLTEALGTPVVYFDSADGFDGTDSAPLPPAAHTHLNWAFDEPGEYTLTLEAFLEVEDGQEPIPVAEGSFRFAVGMEPRDVVGGEDLRVLGRGHTDVTVDLDTGEMYAFVDEEVGADQEVVPSDGAVIDVPNKAVETVPGEPEFSFLGDPGQEVYQLPQAVLGQHVHGEIDPHLWQDVTNAASYVQLIRDTLIEADPDNTDTYRSNADTYLAELAEIDTYVAQTIGEIPENRRQLITTHDAFGYLAEAYGMTVAGFVVPNPAQEPSPEQVAVLTRTIGNLDVPAVFMEPNLARRASVLTQVAQDEGVQVCKLYGDAFDEQARSYTDMMRHNADELLRCLG